MMKLEKYSMGIGDRFGHQGAAQLQAFELARAQQVDITPVWNKSNREHTTIGTKPENARQAAESAVRQRKWTGPWLVDADHIGLKTVAGFIAPCDFFTLDVADFIGEAADPDAIAEFVAVFSRYVGTVASPDGKMKLEVTLPFLQEVACRYLKAVQEAGKIYRFIEEAKGRGKFVTEVSMDESLQPQTPAELFFILGALAHEGVPVQTLAPKFSGRFNKGVDYVGDVAQFTREFDADLSVLAMAVAEFGLPASLKLSVHSGSDKFSLYRPIHQLLRKHQAGVHLKTAGTTWLEEVAGLALAGGDALKLAAGIYEKAYGRFDELCAPYATVIEIHKSDLPAPQVVAGWTGQDFAAALRHDPANKLFNPNFRQLLHVGYKVAAECGTVYTQALEAHADRIAPLVTDNLWNKHIQPVFVG
ncbi:MAG: tagaturonate epimerase family protein [bacterium]